MKRRGFAADSSSRINQSEQPTTAIESVQVTVLLTGGQQYTVTILPDDQLLQDLYETLVAPENALRRLFQIPIDDGRAVLAFTSDRLVGLVTEPPLIIEQGEASEMPAANMNPVANANPAGYNSAAPTVGAAYSHISEIDSVEPTHNPLISRYLQLDQFLSTAEHQAVLEYVAQREGDFVPTNTFTGEANYRESVVLYSFPDYADRIANRIHSVLPQIFQHFSLQPFSVSQVEAQLTAHNDAQFYKIHNDNGSPDTATRELTYVYYFYREPKPFTGGELVLYDSRIQNNYYVQSDTFRLIEPRNNSIVFFLSRYMHEVLPIHCPSKSFTDSRFTINGWIRR